MAVVTWDGEAATMNWNDRYNWIGDAVPGAADDVTINVTESDATILLSGAGASVRSLNNQEGMAIDAGATLTLSGAFSSTVHGAFANSGAVRVQSGGLVLAGGGTSSGSFVVAALASLEFSGDHTLQTSSSISGDGGVRFRSGNTTIAGSYGVSGFTEVTVGSADFTGSVTNVGDALVVGFTNTGGLADFHGNAIVTGSMSVTAILRSTADIMVTRVLNWSDGVISGSGAINIPTDALMNIELFRPVLLDGRTVNNAGTTIWTSVGTAFATTIATRNGVVFNNSGTFEARNISVNYSQEFAHDGVGAAPVFNNTGTFTRSGTFETRFFGPFHNSNAVRVQSGGLAFNNFDQSAGNTILNGGDIYSSSPLNFQGGQLTGSGTIFGSVFNGAITSPGFGLNSPGLITVTGNYVQSSAGALSMELGGLTAGTEQDQLHVTGAVTLDGVLNVRLFNAFVPASGITFKLINNEGVDTVVGAFDNTYVTLGGQQYAIIYNGGTGNDVVLIQSNQPPTANAGGPYTIGEGASLQLNGSGSTDPEDGSALTFEWDLNYNGVTFDVDASGVQPSVSFSDNFPSRTIGLRVKDSGGLSRIATTILEVTNVAPTVGSISAPVDPTPATTLIKVNANFTDPGTGDTHTASWNWGDNSLSSGTVNETNGSGSVSSSHAYTAAGVYTITLTVTDDDSGVGTSTFQYVVVYDPAAGFVTGGGWINSPMGAYAANPSLTGKANFGFESKYLKGNNVPTGNSEFQFKLANFNFKSTSYEWLVVSGAKARYRGVGTVNGAGSYGFELTAWDGQVNGGGDVDRFRIKIWNNNQGNGVVYDNMMGAADGANPTTALGGGSIVIHTSAQPLLATGGTALATGRGLLTQESLNQAVDQTITYWSNMGVDASAVSKLQQIHVEVADPSDAELGIASDTNYIWIDRDAAGYGWQLDSLRRTYPSLYPSITGGMDLLTVVTHEMGHKLGFEHSQETSDLMAPTLEEGVRKLAGSVSQPLGFFGVSWALPVNLRSDVVRISSLETTQFLKDVSKAIQAHDLLFASLDAGTTRPGLRSAIVASRFVSDAKQNPVAESGDILQEDLIDLISTSNPNFQ